MILLAFLDALVYAAHALGGIALVCLVVAACALLGQIPRLFRRKRRRAYAVVWKCGRIAVEGVN